MLGEATYALLHNAQLDAVLVKGVGHAGVYDLLSEPTHGRQLVNVPIDKDLESLIPEMRLVHDVAANWWGRQRLSRYYELMPAAEAANCHLKHGYINLHWDYAYGPLDRTYGRLKCDGPVSMSLRVDDLPSERIFFARRTRHLSLSERGCDETTINAAKRRLARRTLVDLYTLKMTCLGCTAVGQEQGDAVLFRNHPRPTLHAVEGDMQSWALLVHQGLRRIGVSQEDI